jgi:hypothetical protein
MNKRHAIDNKMTTYLTRLLTEKTHLEQKLKQIKLKLENEQLPPNMQKSLEMKKENVEESLDQHTSPIKEFRRDVGIRCYNSSFNQYCLLREN